MYHPSTSGLSFNSTPALPSTFLNSSMALSKTSLVTSGGSLNSLWRGTLVGKVRREYVLSFAARASFERRAGTPLWIVVSFGIDSDMLLLGVVRTDTEHRTLKFMLLFKGMLSAEVRNNSTAFRQFVPFDGLQGPEHKFAWGFPGSSGASLWGGRGVAEPEKNSRLCIYSPCMAFLDASTDCGGIPSLRMSSQGGNFPNSSSLHPADLQDLIVCIGSNVPSTLLLNLCFLFYILRLHRTCVRN
jgi:hypothetical protein